MHRVDLLLAELQSERQLRLKENEVGRAAVDSIKSSLISPKLVLIINHSPFNHH